MKWFNNLKIRTKLLSGFILVAFIAGMVGYVGMTSINTINQLDTELYENNTVPLGDIMAVHVTFMRIRVNLRQIILETDPIEIPKIEQKLADYDKQLTDAMANFEKTIKADEVRQEYNKLVDARKKFTPITENVIKLAAVNQNEEAYNLLNGEGAVYATEVDNAVKKLTEIKLKQAKDKEQINTNTGDSSTRLMLILIAVGVIVAIGVGLLIARIISGIINNLQSQCGELTEAVINGRLDTRGDVEKINFEFQGIIKGINNIVDAFVAPINVMAEYVERIGKGDIPPKITDDYKGDFNEVKNNLNACIDAVNALVADADLLVRAGADGKLNTRANAAKHYGDFRKIIEGFNNTLDAVVRPVNEAADCLKEMAKGNLDVGVVGDYRGDHAVIKDALNTTLASINEILNQVAVAVDQVAAGARQVSDSSQALSQGATEQASSLEEITSSMQEVTAQTKQNAENATQANQLAAQARINAEKGNDQMNEMVKAMAEINESAANISKIIKAIDEIAFQTNLLALNAAVEAARAGKHGKGFTVVAEEVRNLAQRSAKAAKETAEMIEGSIKKTDVGTKIAEDTSGALEEIVSGATKVTDLIGEIASASKEQAEGIGQVNVALGQVDQITQANTASAEESASASEELSSQSLQLKQMLGRFKLKKQGFDAGMTGMAYKNNNQPQGQRWDSATKAADTGEAAATKWGRPEEVISLDDSDFGNF